MMNIVTMMADDGEDILPPLELKTMTTMMADDGEYSSPQELAQTTFSNTTHACTESDFHICRAPSNYGFIEVPEIYILIMTSYWGTWGSSNFHKIPERAPSEGG